VARKKGPNMVSELLQRRANGDGFQTIAIGLKISRNTVKCRLREIGAYEIEAAQKLLLDGFTSNSMSAQYVPEWSQSLPWDQVLSEIVSGSTIREYWEINFESSTEVNLRHVSYESFRREFRRRNPSIDVYYHKTHDPGVRCEIDYKGDTPGLGFIDRATGEFMDCRLFGSVLCNSRLFFPFATSNEKQMSWMAGVTAGFQYFGGATELIVADNTRCAVKQSDWFDPDLNPEFYNFCLHHNTTLIAARPRRPKDKNLIEVHLGVFWRWVRRRLRSRQVFSLGELNQLLRDMADEFNLRYQRKYGSSRRERFEKNEKPKLRPLPTATYEAGEWKTAILHDDCHIQFKYNFYSAPYQHRGKELEVRATFSHLEIFYQQERLAIHLRRPDSQRGNYSTDKAHLPEKFRAKS
jgi:transposase